LKLQPVQIYLGNRAGFEAIAIYVQYLVVIREIFLCQFQDRFFLKRLHKSCSQVKDKVSLHVSLSRCRNTGGFLRALQSQFALVLPFVQIAEVG